MGEWLITLINDIPTAWQVIILAAVPVTELRFSIPVAIAMGVPPISAYGLSIVGNIIPIWPLILFLDPVFKFLSTVPVISKVVKAVIERTRKKGEKVQKYGALGLMLFVSIPAPGSGVWTGSLLAFLFGIRVWYAFPAMVCGVLISGILVTLATVGALEVIARGYTFIIIALLIIGIIYYYFSKKNKTTT